MLRRRVVLLSAPDPLDDSSCSARIPYLNGSMLRIGSAALVFILLQHNSVSGAEYPVLFVHGWCSNSRAWDSMLDNLPRGRFGEEVLRYYQGADGGVYVRVQPGTTRSRSFTIDFYDRANQTFDSRAVADIPTVAKVQQLKAVINQIKNVTGQPKVIIISHSMGGLVGRSYIQGWSLDSSGRPIPYDNDVAGVITIDTPHSGSTLADVPLDLLPWDPSCKTTATVNKAEMTPGSSFLQAINGRSWPTSVRLDTIVSYYTSGLFADSDAIVTRQSQDVRVISDYWAKHASIQAHLQTFDAWRLGAVLHTSVLDSRVTASRVQTIVDEIDKHQASPPAATAFEGKLAECRYKYAINHNSRYSPGGRSAHCAYVGSVSSQGLRLGRGADSCVRCV